PGLMPDPDSPALRLALRLTGQNRAGTVAFSTEAGLFQQAGIAAVICGPGSIDDAHRADEFVALDQLEACGRVLRNVAAGGALACRPCRGGPRPPPLPARLRGAGPFPLPQCGRGWRVRACAREPGEG